MEHNILDEVESDDYPKYGLKAYGYFLKALLSLLLLFIPGMIKYYFNLGPAQFIDLIFLIMFFVFSFLGWRNINKSIRLEERTTNKTTCGEIGIYWFVGFFAMVFVKIVLMLFIG